MLILRALSGKSPANYPASLAPRLAGALAEGLAAPSSESRWPENQLACWPALVPVHAPACPPAVVHLQTISSTETGRPMAIKTPHPKTKQSPSFTLNTPAPRARRPQHLRGFQPLLLGQGCPSQCPPQPGPNVGQPGPVLRPSEPTLGRPMDIHAVAALIGFSPWTVRQKLIPFGLPHFRSGASSKLIFYRDQVVRWIENQQKGG